MAQEYRLTLDGFFGQLASQLTSGATTHTDAAWAGLPTWTGTSYYVPLALTGSGNTEFVWVTAHASGTPNQVTLVRAKENTTTRTWVTGTQFAQADMRRDGLIVQSSATSTADFHVGMQWVEDNTGLIKRKTFQSGIVAAAGLALPTEVNSVAGNPPAGATILHRSGTAVATTNVNGDGTANFVTNFPTAGLIVTATGGDPSVFTGVVHMTGISTSGFTFRAYNLGGSLFVGTLRLQYQATGY
jgi:hypothetical protein